jgi:protein TonB
MKRSTTALLCFLITLNSQSVWATNHHVYKKFEMACQRTLEPRIFGATTFSGWIDRVSESQQQSEPSIARRVAQVDTAKPKVPEATSTKKSEAAPSSPAVAKWHKALATRLARYNRYPAQGNSAEGLVSVAFTIDRKGKVVSSRIEKTSGSTVLDAEALALLARAAPFPAPPPEVTDAELTFVVPVRFTAGEKR